MRRSIAELCAADHSDDPEILAQWLSNKRPENVSTWIARQDATMLVAVKSDAFVAVGMVTDAGEVLLNYVSPDVRFSGVSRALLKTLEAHARKRGAILYRLESTETARRFYRSNGYVETGAPTRKFSAPSRYRMTKSLL
jgi:GNAT superfamily N-acetyltransferase